MVLLEFRLLVSWEFADHPRRFARGGLDKVTPALQVVIVSHLLGEHKRDGNRMNSSKRFTVWYIGFALASIVTLERCRRSCGGALSRNLYRGSINL